MLSNGGMISPTRVNVTQAKEQPFAALQVDSWAEPDLGDQPSKLDAGNVAQSLFQQQTKHEQRLEDLLREHEERLERSITRLLVSGSTAERQTNSSPSLRSPRSPSGILGDQGLALDQEQSGEVWQSQARKAQMRTSTMSRSSKTDMRVPKSAALDHVEAMQQLRKDMHKFKKFGARSRGSFAALKEKEPEEVSERLPTLRFVEKIVENSLFEMISCAFIVINAIMIGAEIEWEIQNPGQILATGFRAMNIVFVVVFTVEWILRVLAQGLAFFSHKQEGAAWNMLDTALVLSSLVEEIVGGAGGAPDMGGMRMFRALRLARSLRIIRVVQAFRNLRVMMRGIVNSLGSLVWAGGLLVSIMYMVTICLLQLVSEEITKKTLDASSGVLSSTNYDDMKTHFGSLFTTIYTLYLSILGGLDWRDAASPLIALSPVSGGVFMAYIAFACLCVLNIITGVFVENANRLTTQEMMLMEQMESRRAWLQEVADLFNDFDMDGSGNLIDLEFSSKLEDIRIKARFEKLGVPVDSTNSERLFELLDFDGDGRIDIDEFTEAMQSMKGQARSIDIAKIHSDTRQLRKAIGRLSGLCKEIAIAQNVGKSDAVVMDADE
mmetsp:Transcript_2374/g.4309  ORF Transcript_2374/g.4309 Transcript_2374/m.4309 type:complete len:607 (-) Transcript_2374:155-1975(-)